MGVSECIIFKGNRMMDIERKEMIGKVLAYTILSIGGLMMLLPFVWMLSTSLKSSGAVFIVEENFLKQLIPSPLLWENYPRAWKAIQFPRYYLNSTFVTGMITLGQVVTSSLAAYAFARLSFPGRDKLFFGYLATMMIPFYVTMIPVFILLKILANLSDQWFPSGLYLFNQYAGKLIGLDSYFALIVPGMFTAYGTFMLRQFFMGLPTDLEEAAKIDGSSVLGIYWRITLPLSKPALATLTVLTFMGAWKDFLWPLIVVSSDEMKTIPVGLASFQGLYTTEWTLLMAGSIIMLIPILLIFLFNQRFFVEGIKLSGIKG
jgi:multiple sugar transport system permease protein